MGATAFHWRTKNHADHSTAAEPRTAAVVITTRADGTLLVESTVGPIVLCSRLPRCPTDCDTSVPRPRSRRSRAERTTAIEVS
ncbi:hypothetical protein [Actinokineospora pegani]|uniref:hypothetical protein n=1 Tax=Actinokineospora pegani TaxID=2654637 RepID=UPI0012E9B7BE|nr:hypothetical protein [Actinokineospora pegani]